ncbi:copper resistance protein CopC [Nonomuraea sp. NPDC046802]|uniref:copper resistance CopC family protein n=1 Tax=Nonomuraea sp. NPDC046802 TaxID=3154919 RepID=UPI0033DAACA9
MNALARSVRRVLAATAGAALVLLLTSPGALAHDRLKSSSPADNAKVKRVETIELEFTSNMRLPTIVLDGPDGEPVPLDKPDVDGAKVSTRPVDDLQPGRYRIAWRVVSSDGHPIQGEITFTVTDPPAEPTPSPSATPSEASAPPSAPPSEQLPAQAPAAPVADSQSGGSGTPGWLWAGIAVLVAGGAAVLVVGRRRGASTSE